MWKAAPEPRRVELILQRRLPSPWTDPPHHHPHRHHPCLRPCCRAITRGALQALGYCHDLGVVHGSLGSGSLMLSSFDDRTAARLVVKLDNVRGLGGGEGGGVRGGRGGGGGGGGGAGMLDRNRGGCGIRYCTVGACHPVLLLLSHPRCHYRRACCCSLALPAGSAAAEAAVVGCYRSRRRWATTTRRWR